ncbi:MerR family transcriptional regulator [Erwinia sp. CPCC 100877]|nr:MerR family transcriptional regulator [Erwinia sp. CPCC 100877]
MMKLEKMETIKAIARRTHLSEDTIRYYEKEKLICPKRGTNNYRMYGKEEFERLKYITVMKYARFSLKEMHELIKLFEQPISLECNYRSREILADKITELEKAIRHYQLIIDLTKELPIPETYEECKENYEQMREHLLTFTNAVFEEIYN